MAEPSREAVAECDEWILDELFRTFDLIESYAVSGKEAARRGDHEEIRLRLRIQLRDCFRYAVETHDLLSQQAAHGAPSAPSEKAEAA
jgi:hypothetical protein